MELLAGGNEKGIIDEVNALADCTTNNCQGGNCAKGCDSGRKIEPAN